jgi:hypothetical protein
MRLIAVALALVAVVAGLGRLRTGLGQVAPNDQRFPEQTALRTVDAPAAWQVQRGSGEVVAAIVGSGVEPAHADLAGNLWHVEGAGEPGCGGGAIGCSFFPPRDPPAGCTPATSAPVPHADVRDDVGVGTALAGIVGAVTNNGFGIAGMAWHVRLMAVKVSGCGAASPAAQVAGIGYAVRQGARVLLFAPETDLPAPGCPALSGPVADALAAAVANGVVVVMGAGDGGTVCGLSAAAPAGVIVVGGAAVAPSGAVTRADFGSLSAQAALAAPAVDLLTTVPNGSCRLCHPSGYRRVSGSSAGAALVAGTAVLIVAQNPQLDPAAVRDILVGGAVPVAAGQGWAGAGLLNAARALARVPATFTGRLSRPGGVVPPGTRLTAFVGDTPCAETRVVERGGRATYLVHVPPAVTRPGCGTDGAPVGLRVEGVVFTAFVPWRSGAQQLDIVLPPEAPPEPVRTPEPAPARAATPAVTAAGPAGASPVGARSRSGAVLAGVVVTDAVSDDLETPGPPVALFDAPDRRVVVWTFWQGDAALRVVSFRWLRPDGTLYRAAELVEMLPGWVVSSWGLDWIGPDGDRMIEAPGEWQVEIAVDGEALGAVRFAVAGGASVGRGGR